jgi:glutamate-1-semialdehyde aminotransferase
MGKSQDLYKRAKRIIPGGTQLLSKRPEMFLPNLWPAYYSKAKGCEVWDLDGKKYVDMSYMGIGSCILGYADPDVDKAVINIINKGSMCTLNAPEEIELAELLVELHPWAQMVRYARTGGEAMAIAVRIARSKTKKDVILFCGYHGWHDWYLSANLTDDQALNGHFLPGLNPLGVPRSLKGTAFPFNYNDTKEFLKYVSEHKGKIGVIVIETIRNFEPEKDFIETIRQTAEREGIVLILDEITSGWRMNVGGAHLVYNIEPDIAVFGKAISNGFPMAAIIGKKSVMQSAQESFISSTYWTERVGPAAALACIRKVKDQNVPQHLIALGKKIKTGWQKAADSSGLKIEVSGIPPLAHFEFKDKNPLVLKTLYTQFMLERGYLASTGFYASYAHKAEYANSYLSAVEGVFAVISKAISDGKPAKYLKGPICHSGFKRLT